MTYGAGLRRSISDSADRQPDPLDPTLRRRKMKQLTRWILALVAVASVAGLSGAWTHQEKQEKQEGKPARKNDPPEIERVYQSKSPKRMSRALKHAAILRALPTFKVSLAEAIQLAEKELGGKSVYADFEVVDGKPIIRVNMFVGDKYTSSRVDPTTKKVTVFVKQPGSREDGADDDGDEEGEDEGGETEEGG